MGAGAEFHQFADRLDAVADAPIATDVAVLLAEIWVDTSKQVMGHDTNQLDNRTTVGQVSGTPTNAVVEVDADTPYAGFHNYGNRFTAPNRFWDEGLEAAERAAGRVGARVGVSIERMLVSGGVWNPPRQ